MDLYPRQRTFKQPSNVQDALYADTYPTANQLRVAAEFRLERSTSPVGGILSVAVFQAARKPALSEVEGDLACSAPSHANYTSPVTSAAIKITTDSPRRPRNSYHISKPSQEAYATPRIYSPHCNRLRSLARLEGTFRTPVSDPKSAHKVQRRRHHYSRQNRHQDQPPRHGNRHRWRRPPLASNGARHSRAFWPAAQRL